MITFNGIRSDERYVVVEHYPTRKYPKRKYITQTVPGRSGDFYISEGEDAFANYQEQYQVFLDAKAPGMPQVTRGLAEWLLRPIGYKRLEDSYDPDFYRMAVPVGGEEFINIFNEYGKGTLTFDCNPKRFYKIGEKEIELSTRNTIIYSPSSFKSHPIVKVYTTGTSGDDRVTAEIYITDKNGQTSTFRMEQVFGTITVDSERHTAVNAGGTNYNSYIKSDYENLYLSQESTISWNIRVTSVTITPRWWTI